MLNVNHLVWLPFHQPLLTWLLHKSISYLFIFFLYKMKLCGPWWSGSVSHIQFTQTSTCKNDFDCICSPTEGTLLTPGLPQSMTIPLCRQSKWYTSNTDSEATVGVYISLWLPQFSCHGICVWILYSELQHVRLSPVQNHIHVLVWQYRKDESVTWCGYCQGQFSS